MSRSWRVLLCGSIVITLSMGIRQVFGLFLLPVTSALDIDRQTFGLLIGLQNLIWGITQPFIGLLADRFGTAKIVGVGGILYVGGLALASTSTNVFQLAIAIGAMVGVAQGATAYAVVLGAIGRAAPPDKRSVSLGIAATAGSVGMFTLVPLTQALVTGLDWQFALTVLAAFTLLIPLLSLGLKEPPAATSAHDPRSSALGALRAASRHPSFWMLNAGFAACGFQLAFLATHLPSYLVDAGLTASTGAVALALIGLSNIVGTYICGLLGARYPKKTVLALLYLARTALFILFLAVPLSPLSATLFAVSLGLMWTGTVPLTNGLVSDIFGTRFIGMLFGFVYVGHQLGAFAGAWAGGYAFDKTGSYLIIWLALISSGILAAALHWPIRDEAAYEVSRQAGKT